jgi:hypothetical protein
VKNELKIWLLLDLVLWGFWQSVVRGFRKHCPRTKPFFLDLDPPPPLPLPPKPFLGGFSPKPGLERINEL